MDMFSVLWGKSFSVIAFLNIMRGVDEFRVGLIPRSETPLIIYLFSLKLLRKYINFRQKHLASDFNFFSFFFPVKVATI